ncbi:MAG TPA: pyrroline-5-carboxylate reductase [bacterium]|nr:pyrroline-5-carboxylate reductase [bacterium]
MAVDCSVALIGAGNMAEALLRGLLGTGTFAAHRCIVANKRNDERLERLAAHWGVRTTRDKAWLMREGDVVVLAVKPHDVAEVLGEIAPHAEPRHLVVSVAAGVPLETIERRLHGVPAVRTMPNTSTAVNASATALCAGRWAGGAHLEIARAMFEAVGRVVVVPEPLFDAVTGLSGSGPAYVYLLAEAMVEAGMRAGLDRETALDLVSQTVLGAGKMLAETGQDPAALRARVTSPNGTTMAGVRALEELGFPDAVREAVGRATARSRELRRGA